MSKIAENRTPSSRHWIGTAVGVTALAMAVLAPGQILAESTSTCSAPPPSKGVPVTVANGTTTPPCAFHQWSWQSFQWLMATSTTGSNLAALPYYQNVTSTKPVAQPRHAKTNEPTLRDFESDQAMSGALVDQNGQLVYYTKQTNSQQAKWITGFANDQTALTANSLKPASAFPPGNFEIKASWRVASFNDANGKVIKSFINKADLDQYYTADFLVPPVTGVTSSGSPTISTTQLVPATLALVGLHIVATTTLHPEFLWATFEHVDNAPACAATSELNPTNPATDNPWSFFGGLDNCSECKSQPQAISHCDLKSHSNAVCQPCNVEPTYANMGPTYKCATESCVSPITLGIVVMEKGVKKNVAGGTSVCTVNPTGGGSSDSMTAVAQVNTNVAAKNKDSLLWHYRLQGTLWGGSETTIGTPPPPPPPPPATQVARYLGLTSIPVQDKTSHTTWGVSTIDTQGKKFSFAGSVALENTTLETYFQGGKNCFSCHSVSPPADKQNNLSLSHLVPFVKTAMPPMCPPAKSTKKK
jgi:hypothetical protein